MAEHDIGKSDRRGDAAGRRKGPDSVSDNLKQVRDAPEAKDLNEIPLDEHAALLTDARLSHPANTEQKTLILTGLQQSHGNAYVQRLLASRGIQAKLTVNPPDDQYEQEADRVADAITQAPVSQVQRQATEEEEEKIQTKAVDGRIPQAIQRQEMPEEEEVQTKPIEGRLPPHIADIQRQEEEEEEVQAKAIEGSFSQKIQLQEMPEEEEVQTKPVDRQLSHNLQRQAEEEEEIQTKAVRGNRSGQLSEALETRISTEKGSGQPLSDSVRTSLEPHFGTDFSEVRVHTNAEANALSRQLGARAFTTGHDIFFGDGEYQPESDSGKGLIGHELTHVVQQETVSSIAQKAKKPKKSVKSSQKLSTEERVDLGADLTLAHNYVNDYFRNAVDTATVEKSFYEELLDEVKDKTKKPEAGLEVMIIIGIFASSIAILVPALAPLIWAAAGPAAEGASEAARLFVRFAAETGKITTNELLKANIAKKVKTAEDLVKANKKSLAENLATQASNLQKAEQEIDAVITWTYETFREGAEGTPAYKKGDLLEWAKTLGPMPILKNKEAIRKEFLLKTYTQFVKTFGYCHFDLYPGGLMGLGEPRKAGPYLVGVPQPVIEELAKFGVSKSTIIKEWGLAKKEVFHPPPRGR